MNIGISLFSGRQPIDAAVVAQKAEALGLIPSGWGNTRSYPCTAVHLLLVPLGAASLISIADLWTPLWPWPGPPQ